MYQGNAETVCDVLNYLAGGMPHEEIIEDFPELTKEENSDTGWCGRMCNVIFVKPSNQNDGF